MSLEIFVRAWKFQSILWSCGGSLRTWGRGQELHELSVSCPALILSKNSGVSLVKIGQSQERKRHININLLASDLPGGGGASLRSGVQRSNIYVLSPEPIENLLSGYPTGKTGDRGDRTEFYVIKF